MNLLIMTKTYRIDLVDSSCRQASSSFKFRISEWI